MIGEKAADIIRGRRLSIPAAVLTES
jgi:hypothetical protein